ncbi:hypothetical protein AVEN_189814-1 [Araneus ventricosus]|uniref:Uncharacterized protein n=1 Tax=Araneus ventricosus TaxID=182803 RepID=A0A4Y2RNK4_ARAVE|nr:hypothetical protein AVEN_189814-1 [Araneus ventricosus]
MKITPNSSSFLKTLQIQIFYVHPLGHTTLVQAIAKLVPLILFRHPVNVMNAPWIRCLSYSNVFGSRDEKTRSLRKCPKGRSHKALNQLTWGGAREQSEAIPTNMPNPAMRNFIVQVSTNVNVPMRGCPVLLENKIPGISSQLQEQLQQIPAALVIIDRMTLQKVWNELDNRLESHDPRGAHRAIVTCAESLKSLQLFLLITHICTCNTLELTAF